MADELRTGELFRAFRIEGKQYLAVRRAGNVHVISDVGENFGAFMSIASFRKYLTSKAIESLGTCDLSVRVLS